MTKPKKCFVICHSDFVISSGARHLELELHVLGSIQLSYALAVSARTREIGVRIALGADRGHVQRFVVGDGLVLVMVGAALGIAGALASTRVLRSLLFDLTPSDPPTYVAIVVILGACALAASWLPARRASRVDPMTALRSD